MTGSKIIRGISVITFITTIGVMLLFDAQPASAEVLAGTITTVAGTGVNDYSGDGLAAKDASLNTPYGVAMDKDGNLYIADTFNNRVRKVDMDGIISTVAGTGLAGYSGDGSEATGAQLYKPVGIALDAKGNLYIADTFNNRIRKVDTQGVITTVAGTGIAGYDSDGKNATEAQLNLPYGITVDGSGNLYIADTYNNRIRKVDTSGMITTVVGTGVAGFNGDGIAAAEAQLKNPDGMTLDEEGNLFIADTWNHRLRKVDATSGIISTVAGTGTEGYSGDGLAATEARLKAPASVALDGNGGLYISDYYNHCIRKVNRSGIISTIAGTGIEGYNADEIAATSAQLDFPVGVAVSGNGNLYIGDMGNSRVRMVTNVIDPDPPVTASVSEPSGTLIYTSDSLPPNITGIAADDPDGSGFLANSTVFSVCRGTDLKYWTRYGWQNEESWLPTEHPETTEGNVVAWEGMSVLPYWRTGDYTITVKVTDRFNQCYTGAPVTFTFQEAPQGIRGDVNADGTVNVLDLTEIVRIILGLE